MEIIHELNSRYNYTTYFNANKIIIIIKRAINYHESHRRTYDTRLPTQTHSHIIVHTHPPTPHTPTQNQYPLQTCSETSLQKGPHVAIYQRRENRL